MLTVSPLIGNSSSSKDSYMSLDDLLDFPTVGGNFSDDLLEGIDYYDDLFIDFDGEMPELDIDQDLLGDYSGGSGTTDDGQEMEGNTSAASESSEIDGSSGGCNQESGGMVKTVCGDKHKGKKRKDCLSGDNKIKKKPKVDWTPELHRKFVQAVEHLGLEKAVPSRILEIMNVQSLNRHNVASHLQKYRSHRKHILTLEAEAKSWHLKRHANMAVTGGGVKKPWIAPALGYPPHVQPPLHQGHFRPLHVWGHPTWPKQKLTNLPANQQRFPVPVVPAAPASWPSHPPYWQLYPQVYGMAPSNHSMYNKQGTSIGVPTRQLGPTNPPIDIHPSSESIDAAIGDVITKPWLPLPLGLKPPSVDSVLTELDCQGVSNVPPLS